MSPSDAYRPAAPMYAEPDNRNAESHILEAATEQCSAELETGDRLVQVFVRPLCEPGVDRGLEMERPLGHTAGRGDHDDHHEVRLQQEHIDAQLMKNNMRRVMSDCIYMAYVVQGQKCDATSAAA